MKVVRKGRRRRGNQENVRRDRIHVRKDKVRERRKKMKKRVGERWKKWERWRLKYSTEYLSFVYENDRRECRKERNSRWRAFLNGTIECERGKDDEDGERRERKDVFAVDMRWCLFLIHDSRRRKSNKIENGRWKMDREEIEGEIDDRKEIDGNGGWNGEEEEFEGLIQNKSRADFFIFFDKWTDRKGFSGLQRHRKCWQKLRNKTPRWSLK